MLKLISFFFFIVPFFVSSQTVIGKIFSTQSTAKNVSVNNKSQGYTSYSDENGDFKILANINDTLVFESILYKRKEIILKQNYFDDVLVVELKQLLNELDQVTLSTVQRNKAFDEKTHTSGLKESIKTDIKLDPYKYTKPNPNMNFVAIIGLIAKLFKKNKLKNKTSIKRINHKQLDSLFQKDLVFNNEFLTKSLSIQTEHVQLFFSYCEAKEIDVAMLSSSKRLEFMDLIFKLSKDYLKFINE